MGKISAGTASFLFEGNVLNLVGDLTYSLAIESSELVKGMDSHVGEVATPQVPFVEGKFRDESDLDVLALQKLDNVAVQMQLRNGKSIIFPDCKQTSRVEQDGSDGTFTLRFESRGTPSEDLST